MGPSIVGTVFLIHQNQLITNYMPGMDDDNLDLINYESVFFFFLRRGRNKYIPHGDIPRRNLLAPWLLIWLFLVI